MDKQKSFIEQLESDKAYQSMSLGQKIAFLKKKAFKFQKDHSEINETYHTLVSMLKAKIIAERGGDAGIKAFGPNQDAQQQALAVILEEPGYADQWKPIERQRNALYWSLKEIEREVECLEVVQAEEMFLTRVRLTEKSQNIQDQYIGLEIKKLEAGILDGEGKLTEA